MNMTQSSWEAGILLKEKQFKVQYAIFFFISNGICAIAGLLYQQDILRWFWPIIIVSICSLLAWKFLKRNAPIGNLRKPTEQEVENVRLYGVLQTKKIPFKRRVSKRIKEFKLSMVIIVFECLTDLDLIKDESGIKEDY